MSCRVNPPQASVGILAYGSLIANPGAEIEAVMTGRTDGVETPFPVEYARTSRGRSGAPTLVPVGEGGWRVRASILLIDATVDDATHRLYRREINRVGSDRRYTPPAEPGPDDVVIKRLPDFHGVSIVLYTHIGANIDDLSAANLARLAIKSARERADGRDGITYLMDAKRYGIKTKLSDEYEEEIRKQLGAMDLTDALRISREKQS